MMEQLRIKDNTRIPKERFDAVWQLVRKIADKTMEQLEREGVFIFPDSLESIPDLEEEQLVLQSFNDSYRSGNVMGIVGYGNQQLMITTRFSTGEDDYFFHYLLEKVLDFPNILDMKTGSSQENQLMNLLLFLFPLYLRNALRKGLFKNYIRRKYNDKNVKGSIDIQRHVIQNTPFTGNVAYSQREYSYDNELMELVRHTIEFLKRKSYGKTFLTRAKDEVNLVVQATPGYSFHERQKIIAANKRKPIRHAYYREYRSLQNLCLLILQNQKTQIGSGARQVYGILFDGAWLWEEYVNLLIEDIFYHPMNRKGKDAQRLFEGNIGLIYPDFISRDSTDRVIADAKYKPMENIGNKDYLQVLAYMLRFDAKRGLYLYPNSQGPLNQKLRLNSGSTYEKNVGPRENLGVIKQGLHIPENCADYNGFVKAMKSQEEIFRVTLREWMKP